MDRAQEARHLAGIRARLAALDGADWTLAAEDGRMRIFARTPDDMVGIADFTQLATTDDMQLAAYAPQDMRFLLSLLDRCAARVKALAPPEPNSRQADAQASARHDGKNHAAEAAMLCAVPAFKRFLMERHGLESPASDERAAQKLRGLLGVSSRRGINENRDALARWKALRADFYTWKGREVV